MDLFYIPIQLQESLPAAHPPSHLPPTHLPTPVLAYTYPPPPPNRLGGVGISQERGREVIGGREGGVGRGVGAGSG